MRTRAVPDVIGLSSLFVLGGVLAAASWLTWPDLLIDFGREAYVAWRLGEGDALYLDVAYHNGPLSPHWNAWVMRASGMGLHALFLSNALVLGACLVLIHERLRAIADLWTAWAANAFFLLVFAFGRYADIGNYTYMAPYSHEITHGLVLSLAALGCAARAQRASSDGAGRARSWAMASGLLLGAAALTKVEILAALLPALVLASTLEPAAAAAKRAGLKAGRLPYVLAGAGSVLLTTLALLALATPLSASEAIGGLTAGIRGALDPRLTALPFYRWGAGLDDPGGNALRLLDTLGLEAALIALGILAARALQGRRNALLIATAALPGLALLLLRDQIAWLEAARPLPLYLLAIGAWRAAPLLRADAAASERARAISELPWIVFAGLLLFKLGLNARVYHYGFVLAMPASLVVVAALLSWIPRELDRRGLSGAAFRAFGASLLAATALAHLELGTLLLPELTASLGSGHDRVIGAPRIAEPLSQLLTKAELGPDDEMLVVPEGVVLNYLARRKTPTPHLNFTPFDLLAWGEDQMLRALEASRPATILRIQRDTSEYGAEVFGRDYGRALDGWIRSHYRRSWHSGADRSSDGGESLAVELWVPRTVAPR